MTSRELRQKYLDFFKSKGHAILPSASLIPQNDPTVLFTTAGMHPLVPYLMGEPHPEGKRVADAQKCVRTGDIDDVGDNRHLTFFEMLGNWSFGDYFKKEAIEWSWEFMTSEKWLGLDPKRIYVTVFMGDENSPIDDESIEHWKRMYESVGIKAEVCDYGKKIEGDESLRIFPLTTDDNWWGPAGETGPCGPCTEMFYDTDPSKGVLQGTFDDEIDAFRVMEIWNDVFMEFNKTAEGKFERLAAQSVDTGMGLERTIAVLHGHQDVFAIDMFEPIFEKLEKLSGKKYLDDEDATQNMRVIADHIKSATFMIGDPNGVSPSNTDQGYIIRRLIRRAVRAGKQIGIKEQPWTQEIAKIVIHDFQEAYPELRQNGDRIIEELEKEEMKFYQTLEKGEKQIKGEEINGDMAFNLFQTYGYPVEMTREIAEEKNIKLSEAFDKEFEEAMNKHQDLSRTAAAGKFKGGLADAGDETRELHTAAHLMLEAMRRVLGNHVEQKGSNITAERLRFDFSHGEKLTDEQKSEIEKLVNEQIEKDQPVSFTEVPLEEAKEMGATGVFESKYGEKVKVYQVGEGDEVFSKEICGGPHVEQTGGMGVFKIKKEKSSSAGVRRVKAVLEKG